MQRFSKKAREIDEKTEQKLQGIIEDLVGRLQFFHKLKGSAAFGQDLGNFSLKMDFIKYLTLQKRLRKKFDESISFSKRFHKVPVDVSLPFLDSKFWWKMNRKRGI